MMSANQTEPAADASLDERKFWLARQQYALDNSWPRKWGSVIGGPLIAALVSLSVALWGYVQHNIEAARTRSQQTVENDRTALDMYFRYVADQPEDSPHRADHIAVIQAVAASPDLLAKLRSQQTKAAFESRPGDKAPSEVGVGLPDVKVQQADHTYGPGDFLAYVQYFEPRAVASQQVTQSLGDLGIKVPGQQAMPDKKSPDRNQIRIYREAHRTYAQTLAGQLKQKTGLEFQVVGPIGGGNLPNGVIEIWLGKNS